MPLDLKEIILFQYTFTTVNCQNLSDTKSVDIIYYWNYAIVQFNVLLSSDYI